MGEIPESVWRIAETEARKITHTPIGHDVVKAIACAILAERKRCADAASAWAETCRKIHQIEGADVAEDITAIILNPPT